MAATTSAAAPSSGRDSPAPNMASMMRSAPAKRSGRQRLDVRRPSARPCGSIAGEPLARAQQADAHAIPLLPQQPRRHEAVAAVVARPAGDHDDRRALAGDQLDGRIGNRAPGRLHQRKPGHACRDRQRDRRGPFLRRSAVHAQARRHLAALSRLWRHLAPPQCAEHQAHSLMPMALLTCLYFIGICLVYRHIRQLPSGRAAL